MKTVLTYGTFDLFHIGHLNLLERLSRMGDRLIVGVSSDSFNKQKGKSSLFPYEERARIISSLYCVEYVFPELNWFQKPEDIKQYDVDVFGIGDDWKGKFDYLDEYCKVVYLPRTENISSSSLKESLQSYPKPFENKDTLDIRVNE